MEVAAWRTPPPCDTASDNHPYRRRRHGRCLRNRRSKGSRARSSGHRLQAHPPTAHVYCTPLLHTPTAHPYCTFLLHRWRKAFRLAFRITTHHRVLTHKLAVILLPCKFAICCHFMRGVDMLNGQKVWRGYCSCGFHDKRVKGPAPPLPSSLTAWQAAEAATIGSSSGFWR